MWENITDGQGAVLAAVITFFAATVSVLIGVFFYRGKAITLEKAIEHSEKKIGEHIKNITDQFAQYEEVIGVQFKALSEQATKTAAIVADLPTSIADPALIQDTNLPSSPTLSSEKQTSEISYRDQLLEDWTKIRDRIEAIASDPNVDGRTAAKYTRIDRRQYLTLVEALDADNRLGKSAQLFKEAIELWQRYRPNRAPPSEKDVQRMKALAIKLES